ncbi:MULTISPECIES: alpha-ribazole phosphatase [Flavobacterium]|uniref:alpha-ribazole phosphatase n=1 Tax=Flavobacterium TaxID=237 RepID=UPI001FCA57B9|nr:MULTISPECIES: alpha-ribazole phosphatase [Flavobacterium]UOK42426.1 alpha-ribazole phosphatase [Flavobacterium enshiense]
MEIYLVRHTETVCRKGICYGQSDVGLLEPFINHFESIKEQIPSNAVFFSSPLQRCTVLADYLTDGNYETDVRLMEMSFGDWEMKKWDDINPEELNPWMKDYVHIKVPNGESFTELYNRVIDFAETTFSSDAAKPIVLVTHAGVIRSLLCKINNLPLKDAFQNKVEFGSVVKIQW